jgi:hypothetical protein
MENQSIPKLRVRENSQGLFVPEIQTKSGKWIGFNYEKHFSDGSRNLNLLYAIVEVDRPGNYYIKKEHLGFVDTKIIFFHYRYTAYAFLGMIRSSFEDNIKSFEL